MSKDTTSVAYVGRRPGYTVLCQIPGTVDGASVKQCRFRGTSVCAMQSGLMSIVAY